MKGDADSANWRLYLRALDILDGKRNGHALPIIRKLAVRGFAPAVTVLTDFVSEDEAIRLLRRASHGGDATATYNLAITHRNRGDLGNYRRILARAARLDPEAMEELRQFKTRFPHEIMRRFRRLSS